MSETKEIWTEVGMKESHCCHLNSRKKESERERKTSERSVRGRNQIEFKPSPSHNSANYLDFQWFERQILQDVPVFESLHSSEQLSTDTHWLKRGT
jgi:hypothetical protein